MVQKKYERAVLVLKYDNYGLMEKIERFINDINLRALGSIINESPSVALLNTYKFSEQDHKNEDIDFISGFEIIDSNQRLYLLEGISDLAMKELETYIQKDFENNQNTKYLKNNKILYKDRLYREFEL